MTGQWLLCGNASGCYTTDGQAVHHRSLVHALRVESINVPDDRSRSEDAISGTERAIYGSVTSLELRTFLDAWARNKLGSAIAEVAFRAGRIDVVWGVALEDGRGVVIKTHRPPVDMDAIRSANEAQRLLAAAGFPTAVPLAGPDEVEGHVLTAETLIKGSTPEGRSPAVRLLLADGLARHIDLLREHHHLARGAGAGPSWCHYQAGPWPVPHDTIVDFRSTPDGFEWLDEFGQRAADQILAHRNGEAVVVGHADWYAGNTATSADVLVGTFDWELVADTEAVIAGFAAAAFAASSTGGGGLSTPEEAAAFMRDYDTARGRPLTSREQRTAAGAAAWIVAFNARWQVGLIAHGLCDEATISLARDNGLEYLGLVW
jgi:Ser/Thr protein kinase RdoA (MazF antagonist)